MLLGITYFLLAFVIIYFNAALVGAAMVRLAGGTPTLGDGFRLANSRLPQIAGWALISATVGLILQILRSQSRDNFVGQIALSVVGGVWAYLTFFVVPVLVAEQTGPISAIKRSSSLFKRDLGRAGGGELRVRHCWIRGRADRAGASHPGGFAVADGRAGGWRGDGWAGDCHGFDAGGDLQGGAVRICG